MKSGGQMQGIGFNLYLITERRGCLGRGLHSVVEEALQAGVRGIQLREKDLPPRELYALALELRSLTSRYDARLLINDRIDIALAVGADGVHLGEHSIPADVARNLLGQERLLGVSCHCVESAVAAEEAGADFVTLGPVYFTPSKAAYGEPLGLAPLAEAARLLNIPVFALGGINREKVKDVLTTGVGGIALISAILATASPRDAAAELLALLHHGE